MSFYRRYYYRFKTLKQASWIFIVGCILIWTGCNSKSDVPDHVKIQGLVTYNGQPLKNGEVIYSPVDTKQGRPARGRINEQGEFSLITSAGIPGVVFGEYRVIVQSFEKNKAADKKSIRPPVVKDGFSTEDQKKPAIPAKYLDPDKTDLFDSVDSSHSGKVQFDLQK